MKDQSNGCHSNSWGTLNNFGTAAAASTSDTVLKWHARHSLRYCDVFEVEQLQIVILFYWRKSLSLTHLLTASRTLFFCSSQHDKWTTCLHLSCLLQKTPAVIYLLSTLCPPFHLRLPHCWESLLKTYTTLPRLSTPSHPQAPTPPTSTFSPGAGYL